MIYVNKYVNTYLSYVFSFFLLLLWLNIHLLGSNQSFKFELTTVKKLIK